MHLEPVAAVDQRVAENDGTTALHVEDEVVRFEAFERASAERQRVAAAEHLSAHRIGIGRVGRRDVDRQAELRRVGLRDAVLAQKTNRAAVECNLRDAARVRSRAEHRESRCSRRR